LPQKGLRKKKAKQADRLRDWEGRVVRSYKIAVKTQIQKKKRKRKKPQGWQRKNSRPLGGIQRKSQGVIHVDATGLAKETNKRQGTSIKRFPQKERFRKKGEFAGVHLEEEKQGNHTTITVHAEDVVSPESRKTTKKDFLRGEKWNLGEKLSNAELGGSDCGTRTKNTKIPAAQKKKPS